MARRRFFVEEIRNRRAVLEEETAEHLRRVLRVEPGQQFELSDNRGVYLAEVEGFGRRQVWFRVLEQLPAEEPPVRLALKAALVKFDRFEWLIEKATELGVERIVPVEAARSEKGLDQGAAKRLDRWRRIAREASQQARRARLPEISAPATFAAALADDSSCRLFLDETRTCAPMLAALPPPGARHRSDSVALLVGPEGGWTEQERAAALEAGWTQVSLGPYVLRSETAAMAALAVLVNAWPAAESGNSHPGGETPHSRRSP